MDMVIFMCIAVAFITCIWAALWLLIGFFNWLTNFALHRRK